MYNKYPGFPRAIKLAFPQFSICLRVLDLWPSVINPPPPPPAFPPIPLLVPIKAVLSLQGDGQPLLLLPPIDPLSELTSEEDPILFGFPSDFFPRGRGELSGVFSISEKDYMSVSKKPNHLDGRV